jgi:hypothetical protein
MNPFEKFNNFHEIQNNFNWKMPTTTTAAIKIIFT